MKINDGLGRQSILRLAIGRISLNSSSSVSSSVACMGSGITGVAGWDGQYRQAGT